MMSFAVIAGQVRAMTPEEARKVLAENDAVAVFRSMASEGEEAVKVLLAEGMDVNMHDEDGFTVLMKPVDDDAHKQALTVGILRAMATAIGSYQVDFNVFPAAENGPVSAILYKEDEKDGVTDLYYAGQMVDMWGTDIMYSSDGESFRLTSFGADKTEGNSSGEFDADIIFVDGQLVAPEGLLD
jgi:hypothetical protein